MNKQERVNNIFNKLDEIEDELYSMFDKADHGYGRKIKELKKTISEQLKHSDDEEKS